jgi:HEPN domain-containing protein
VTNAAALAQDYARRARMRTVELAVKALLKLRSLTYPRAHDVARLLRDPSICGPLLAPEEVAEIEQSSKALRRDRELSFYGDEDVVPLDYYERSDADDALVRLRRVLELVERVFVQAGSAGA